MDRRSFFALPLAAAAQSPKREIRLLSLAPSPYTQRKDSYRAGAGILLSLRRLIEEHSLPATATYYDAAARIEKPSELMPLVRGASVLLIGSSVWAQGPSWVVRKFFEVVDAESLAGVSASAWVTSGGALTGAEASLASTFSSLHGMGASTFTFGQKQMMFTTDERVGTPEKAGEFTLLDCWFMEGLAKASLVAALAPGDPAAAKALWSKLQGSPIYYAGFFPKDIAALEARFGAIRQKINAAANPRSESRKEIDSLLSR